MFVNVNVNVNGRHDGRSKGDGGQKADAGRRMPEDGCRRVLVKRKGYNFELFNKVSLAKIAYVSDILQAHEVWKIILWR